MVVVKRVAQALGRELPICVCLMFSSKSAWGCVFQGRPPRKRTALLNHNIPGNEVISRFLPGDGNLGQSVVVILTVSPLRTSSISRSLETGHGAQPLLLGKEDLNISRSSPGHRLYLFSRSFGSVWTSLLTLYFRL